MLHSRARILSIFILAAACVSGCDKPADKAPEQGAAGDVKAADGQLAAGGGADAGAAKPACDNCAAADTGADKGKAADDGKLVVYSARSAKLVDPLIQKFEAATGVKVDVRYGDSTNLVTKLRTEGDQTDADVFFAQDLGNLGVLRDAKLLRPLPESITGQTQASLREASGAWVVTSGRVRVLVYNPDKVKPEELPLTLKELADPKWKGKLGWAPTNGSFQAHVSALRALWGEQEAEAWLTGMKANEPVVYPKNSPQVAAVDNGEIQIGWVNHYYMHELRRANPALRAANYSFRTPGDAGNLMMLSGVGVIASTKRSASAEKFAAFLVSKEAQTYFTQETFEYPTTDGVETHPDVPGIATLSLVEVDQRALTDLAPTLSLLQKLGIP